MQHHKPEYPVEKWDYCIQGQGHSEGSKCSWMFVQTISSEPNNILLPNLVCLCSIIMNQSVMQKTWFTVFSVKVTVRAYIIKIWLFLLYLLNAGQFATKLGLIVQHHKSECLVEKLDYCIQGQGHSEGSKCQWMFVWMILSPCFRAVSPELLNHFWPNLVL